MDSERVNLPLDEIPTAWYNVLADLPQPLPPPLHPGTGQPLGPADLAPIFPMALIEQEMSGERWIEIPDPVRELYKIWRPTPLVRAVRLEKALKTTCRIYFKNESVSPAGSHKLNTALAQAYYNKQEGVRRLSTETGAGQWGSSMAFACQVFGLGCTVAALMPNYGLFGAALIIIGASAQTLTTGANILVQLGTDPAMRGRVLAILLAILLGGTPIGAPIVGWVADTFGPRWALGVGAASGFAAAAVGLFHLKRRRPQRLPIDPQRSPKEIL